MEHIAAINNRNAYFFVFFSLFWRFEVCMAVWKQCRQQQKKLFFCKSILRERENEKKNAIKQMFYADVALFQQMHSDFFEDTFFFVQSRTCEKQKITESTTETVMTPTLLHLFYSINFESHIEREQSNACNCLPPGFVFHFITLLFCFLHLMCVCTRALVMVCL